ncbi:MAG: 5'/3'-nucleotidase SurE [candidate division Zixibacteria bacterium]
MKKSPARKRKLNILVTNDDGYFSDGIKALAKELGKTANVYIVAPDREQSASSHSLTLNRPLRAQKISDNCFAIDGTPTDCVMLAIHLFFKSVSLDMIVSGINHGPNMGDDITYSGTVAAAIEGSILQIPSLAISMSDYEPDMPMTRAASWAAKLVRAFPKFELEPSVFLNVNLPPDNGRPYKDFLFTKPGVRKYKDIVIHKTDPRGKSYYWIGGKPKWQNTSGTDFAVVKSGKISISPMKPEFLDTNSIKKLGKANFKL